MSLTETLLILLILSRTIGEIAERYGQPSMILVLMAVVTTLATPLLFKRAYTRLVAALPSTGIGAASDAAR